MDSYNLLGGLAEGGPQGGAPNNMGGMNYLSRFMQGGGGFGMPWGAPQFGNQGGQQAGQWGMGGPQQGAPFDFEAWRKQWQGMPWGQGGQQLDRPMGQAQQAGQMPQLGAPQLGLPKTGSPQLGAPQLGGGGSQQAGQSVLGNFGMDATGSGGAGANRGGMQPMPPEWRY